EAVAEAEMVVLTQTVWRIRDEKSTMVSFLGSIIVMFLRNTLEHGGGIGVELAAWRPVDH
ncbi:MAG: hypothetical protein Q4D98_13450, partial [Planctomycetia bacterium]|nr:hypothetical protein [Planctomycetia bacterium]